MMGILCALYSALVVIEDTDLEIWRRRRILQNVHPKTEKKNFRLQPIPNLTEMNNGIMRLTWYGIE